MRPTFIAETIASRDQARGGDERYAVGLDDWRGGDYAFTKHLFAFVEYSYYDLGDPQIDAAGRRVTPGICRSRRRLRTSYALVSIYVSAVSDRTFKNCPQLLHARFLSGHRRRR